MPRIAAPSIQEHVRRQQERLLEAASRLFRERGLHGTDMGDIAAEVNLARNSIYRYYPNKDHILLACVERDMEPVLEKYAALESGVADPRARIDAWIDLSIDIATSPVHATMALISEIQESSPELRQQILKLHMAPNGVLDRAVKAVLVRQRRDPALVTAMIAGMVQSGAGQAIRRASRPAVKRELMSAVAKLLLP